MNKNDLTKENITSAPLPNQGQQLFMGGGPGDPDYYVLQQNQGYNSGSYGVAAYKVGENNQNQPVQQGKNAFVFDNLDEVEKRIRLGFVRKVFACFLIQLVVTFGLVCLTFIDEVKEWIYQHVLVTYIVCAAAFILLMFLMCCRKISRKFPLNYILTIIWTLMEAYLICALASFYNYKIVLTAMGLTVGMIIGLTAYACFSRVSYSSICRLLFGFLGIGIFLLIFGFWFGKWLYTIYCAFGVAVFSVYLVYDTRLIIGQFGIRYSIDDYIVAALNLYIDAVNIFMNILSLIGR